MGGAWWDDGSSSGGGSSGTATLPNPSIRAPKQVTDQQKLQTAKSQLQTLALRLSKATSGTGGNLDPNQIKVMRSQLQQAYNTAGLTKQDMAALPQSVQQVLRQNVKVPGYGDSVPGLLDALSRPGKFVQAGLEHGALGEGAGATGNPFDFGQAVKAFAGKQDTSPANVVQAVLHPGEGQQAVSQRVAKMNPIVRAGTNAVVGTVLDPLTYIGLGPETTALESARSVAPALAHLRGLATAEEAAKAAETGIVTEFPGIRAVATDLLQKGSRAVTSDEAAQLAEQGMGKAVEDLKGAAGGLKIAGRSVPGTNFLSGPKAADRLAAMDAKVAATRGTSAAQEAALGNRAISGATQDAYKEAAKAGLKPAEVDARIMKALDRGNQPEDWAALLPKERQAAETINLVRQRMTESNQGAGLLSEHPPAGAIPTSEYVPGYATPEARAEMSKMPVGQTPSGKGGVGPSSNLQARQYEGPIGERTTEGGAPFYERNPAVAMIRRNSETQRDVAQTDATSAFLGIKDANGKPLAVMQGSPEHEAIPTRDLTNGTYRTINVPSQKLNPETGVVESVAKTPILVHKSIAPEAERVFKFLGSSTEDTQVKAFLKGVDRMNKLWKTLATVPGPFSTGFIGKYISGHAINGWLLTGHLKTMGADATFGGRLVHALNKGIDSGDWEKFLAPEDVKLVKEAQRYHVMGANFYSAGSDLRSAAQADEEATAGLVRQAGSKVLNSKASPLNPANPMYAKPREALSSMSDALRIGLFKRLRSEGMTPASAATVTNKYLFDYSNINGIGRGVQRYVSPFFAWTYKNVPLQVETLLKHPGYLTGQVHALQGLQSISPLDNSQVPDWARGSMPIGLGDHNAAIPNLPIVSASDTLEPLTKVANDLVYAAKHGGNLAPGEEQDLPLSMVNASGAGGPTVGGLTSLMLQLGLGKNAFSGAPVAKGAMTKTPSYLGGGWLPGAPKFIPVQMQTALEELAPALSKLRRTFPTAEKDKAKQGAGIISALAGIQTTPVNDKTALNNAMAGQEVLATVKKWLTDQGAKVPLKKDLNLPAVSAKSTAKSKSTSSKSSSNGPWWGG